MYATCFLLSSTFEIKMGDTMRIGNSMDTTGNREGSPKLNVYIWDMDETLILLKSLLNGTYAEPFNGLKDVQKGVEIGKLWEKHILQVCDDYFLYEQIENCNTPFLDAFSQYDDGRDLSDYDFNQDGFSPPCDDINKRKLAYRHRVIAQKYKKGIHGIFDQDMIKLWDDLYDATDNYTDRWLTSARACVEQCSGRNKELTSGEDSAGGISDSPTKFQHINVLVTSGSLIPSLVKCLLFRLDDLITSANVYSSWEVGKLQCFSWIRERFNGPNVQFCVIGDGWEECEAAQTMRWPFVKVDVQPGSSHRFPGLTLRTLNHYFSVVYGNGDAKNADNE
ncbi:eyes absent homolog isoform X1 [Camellia sinensis]|uniref:eyes absent homolog isoform X1 n=1 Tax=Camellia sinensis TaxID=4442 RepID=UPI001035FD9C|nr:eyes absent homolog isoform X1 [Camellia sinensis]XP_028109931.1 eyes absent homolog isoform X1 [Camellia sinensis]XP_028109932.1 eyes absent homolog isoform X1 [Camellia sinensis]